MKHCCCTLLYNELPFLIQKLPFLYENFQQLVFYDMNVMNPPHFSYSTDGSHEYLKNYNDPDRKITLIENLDFPESLVVPTSGNTAIWKQKMVARMSLAIRDDIDVVWLPDADEFFTIDTVKKVEEAINNTESIKLKGHYTFWKNYKLCIATPELDYVDTGVTRIYKHKPNQVYAHCEFITTSKIIEDEYWYHFAFIGKDKTFKKWDYYEQNYKIHHFYDTHKAYFASFDEALLNGEELYGYPSMFPSYGRKGGVKRFTKSYPDYINLEVMQKMLDESI